jgi:tRNA A-37 threonylcarbamoyl transferase component Bud32
MQIGTQAALTKLEIDLRYVKNQMPFKSNTIVSMAQFGQVAIEGLPEPTKVFSPVDGAPSVLNQEQQDVLNKLTKENEVVRYLTPRFEEIFAEANVVVVNSENYGWIDTGGGKKNFQNPDLLICHEALYTAASTTVDRDRRFGELSNWILRDCIGAIMEAKLSFAGNLTSAVGKIVNYSAHLAHNCNERTVVKGVLFDKHKFYFAFTNNGTLSSLIECKWTDAGSETFLRESLYPPGSWIKLLDAACQRHSLVVEPGSFLGYGAHGRVFKVSNSSEEQYAVKLVLKENVNHLTCESNMLQPAYTVCPKHVIRVVHPSENFEDIGGFMVTELGTMVERDEYKQIIEALVALHRSNVTHGDARVNNVVEVGEVIKWIDFRQAQIPTDNLSDQQRSDMLTRMKQLDMMTLMKSLLQISQDGDLPPRVCTLVVWNYNENVTDDQIQKIIEEFKKIYDSVNEMPVFK